MEKEFIPYELALKLKELGFNEECGAYYSPMDNKLSNIGIVSISSRVLKAPLWQQVFSWFRNEYGIDSTILPTSSTKYLYRLYEQQSKSKTQIYGEYMSKEYKTYEKARQACLEKLIEICKKN